MIKYHLLFMRFLSYIPTWKRKEYTDLVDAIIKELNGGKK